MSLRAELPPLPARLERLPVHRGYPVPWFASWLDPATGDPTPRGTGEPDFRVLFPGAVKEALGFDLCWICGGRLGSSRVAFVAGPMCGLNRTSTEPPSHVDCAAWSAVACPFLVRPHMRRREAGLPEEVEPMPGVALMRNPGVAMLWVTRRWGTKRAPDGTLFDIGKSPERVEWFCEGRPATRQEVEDSIASGLPALVELAEKDGALAVRELNRRLDTLDTLLPPPDPVRA